MTTDERLPVDTPPGFPEAVVFDLDGLMIDSEQLDWKGAKAVAARRGFDLDDEFLLRTIGRRGADIQPEFDSRFAQHLDYGTFTAEVRQWRHDYVLAHGMAHKRGLAELLDHLDRTGTPRAVATSTVRHEALASMGALSDRLQAVAFGDEVKNGKPAPDIYLLATQRLGFAPAQCLALEDSLAGVAAAERAGLTVIMVPDLIPANAGVRYVCSSLMRVRDWLLEVAAARASG
jgi:HAD superfamily hydrolase (TIGR01509 family)